MVLRNCILSTRSLALLLTLLMSGTFISNAGIIKTEDIAMISIQQPSNWQTFNTQQLFDGIDDRYTPTRFAAYQKKGDLLTSSAPFNISVALVSGVNVSSISFFNDWRYHLNQQVAAMNVSLYGVNSRLLWNSSFNNLQQNTWDKIDLVSFDEAINDVMRIDFTVVKSQGNHFEIREFVVGTQEPLLLNASATSPVSAPNVGLMLMLGLGLLGYVRYVSALRTKAH